LHGLTEGRIHGRKSNNRDDVKAIRRVGKEYLEATNAGNPERCIATMAPDVIIIPPGRPAVVGKERVRRLSQDYHKTFDLKYRLVYDQIEVRKDLGFVRSTVTGKRISKPDGRVEKAVWRNFWVVKKQADGKWKFWRIMVNS